MWCRCALHPFYGKIAAVVDNLAVDNPEVDIVEPAVDIHKVVAVGIQAEPVVVGSLVAGMAQDILVVGMGLHTAVDIAVAEAESHCAN